MSLVTQIYNRLNDNFAGTLCADRVYISQKDIAYEGNIGLPYIIINVLSSTPSNTKQGPSPIDKVRVQINMYAANVNDVEQLSDYVRSALDYSGTCGSPFNTDGILQWQSCVFDSEQTEPYVDSANNDGVFGKSMDFIFRTNRLL
jgi:hypothetical protein